MKRYAQPNGTDIVGKPPRLTSAFDYSMKAVLALALCLSGCTIGLSENIHFPDQALFLSLPDKGNWVLVAQQDTVEPRAFLRIYQDEGGDRAVQLLFGENVTGESELGPYTTRWINGFVESGGSVIKCTKGTVTGVPVSIIHGEVRVGDLHGQTHAVVGLWRSIFYNISFISLNGDPTDDNLLRVAAKSLKIGNSQGVNVPVSDF